MLVYIARAVYYIIRYKEVLMILFRIVLILAFIGISLYGIKLSYSVVRILDFQINGVVIAIIGITSSVCLFLRGFR
jgi:hypothetical protein